MNNKDFDELHDNHWCAIAWESTQKKPNMKIVKERAIKISKILYKENTKFSKKRLQEILKNAEKIASSENKKFVIRKSKELCLD